MRRLVAAFLLVACAGGCQPKQQAEEKRFLTTIPPLRAILAEIIGQPDRVQTLLGPGASPHTYSIRPSDARMAESALALFYVAEDLDGWAARLPAQRRIAVFELLAPSERLAWSHEHHEHGAGDWDTHFWTNPRTVATLIPQLLKLLVALEPQNDEVFTRNAERFSAALAALDVEIRAALADLSRRKVILFHPSFNYFLREYDLELAGLIEPVAGVESSPRELQALLEKAQAPDGAAIFTEPQLPRRPAELIADEARLELFELDPLGGQPGRETYFELMRYNTSVLQKALR